MAARFKLPSTFQSPPNPSSLSRWNAISSRILITDEENLGSVQIGIPFYVSNIFGKADALIYALFVDNNHRRNGVAQRLLQLAEQQAKLNGVKTIGLEYFKDESDRFVLDWYLRSGYKPFDKKSNLLIKKLDD